MKTIPCPKCKRGEMEMFGVTERGAYKYACPRCYHHHEEMKARIMNPSTEPSEKILPRIDPDDIELLEKVNDSARRVYLYERAVEQKTPTLNEWLETMMKLRMKRLVHIYDAVKRKFTT